MKMLKKVLDPSEYRLWYNDWINKNAKGKVLDVGKSIYWDYGFPTLDINKELDPTFTGNIENTAFPKETFDVVLCNGMYEFVETPGKMISECLRITKQGGKVIFGFVGRDYKSYKNPWKFYEGKEYIPNHIRKDFNNEYHFIIVNK